MSRTVTLAGYGLLAAAMAGYQVIGLVRRRTPTLGQAASALTRHPVGRWLLLAAWLWVGWHLFVRSDWA